MGDKITRKAKSEGYKARSAYKLLEVDGKYKFLNKDARVLDLGCWPGSWLQVASKKCKEVIGIDLRKTEIKNIKTFVMDIFSDKVLDLGKFDIILSDVAPGTSGNIEIDQYRSYELSVRAFNIAKKLLKENGSFLVKIFQGEDSDKLLKNMKKRFKLAKGIKPSSSKKKSKEIYYIGLGFR